MAVEIPVYVDISAGIDQAIKQLPKETKKLQQVVSKNALKLNFDIGGGAKSSLSNILTSPDMSKGELKAALASIRKEFERISQASASKKQTKGAKDLARAYAAVEQRLTGVSSKTSAAMMMTQDAINKVVYKIQQLKASLSMMVYGSDQWNKTNYQLNIQKKRLQDLNVQLRQYKMEAAGLTGLFSHQHSVLTKLAGQMSMYVSAYSLIRFVKQIRDVTGELEYQRVALGHLLQDEEYGNQLFGRILDLAKESPFRIRNLVEYTKQLAAYRIEQEDLYDTTKRLADISAGLGVDMNRLILAYGQVRAASVLRGQELRQFTEAGIPLVDLLAEKFSDLNGRAVTTAEVFKKISERAVPFSMIAEIFQDLTDKGGMFFEMQETQAKTLKGRWEKLKDAYDIALSSIGEDETFQKWNDTALRVLNAVAKNLKGIVRFINAAAISWVTYSVATSKVVKYSVGLSAMFVKEYGLVNALKMGVNGLAAAFQRLGVAMKANWVGLALSAVTGLITYFTTFRNKTDDAVKGLRDVEKSIEAMSEANKKYAKEGGLIRVYGTLAAKTDRTAKENLKLANTMDKLKESFPELVSKIGDENTALEEQVGLLEDAREKRLEEQREEAKEALAIEENRNKELRQQYEQELADYNEKNAAFKKAKQDEEKGAAAIAKETGGYYAPTQKELEGITFQLRKVAEAAEKTKDETKDLLDTSTREITRLRGVINPEEAEQDLESWQKELLKIYEAEKTASEQPVFTPEEIRKMTSVYDLFKKLKKRTQDLTESLKGLRSALSGTTDADTKEKMQEEATNLQNTANTAEEIRKRFGFDFSSKKTSGRGYTEDPFIQMMKDRMSYMKDFRKGYEDLSKFMSKENALARESEIMKTRGLALGIDVEQQKQAAGNLSEWYQQQINDAFAAAKKKGAKGATVTDFLSQQISDKSNAGKTLKAFQQLIQSLFDAKTDLDTTVLEDNLKKALDETSEKLKRSAQARSFFNDILAATGDEEVAATITMQVYGQTGDELKKRVQDEMLDALNNAQKFMSQTDYDFFKPLVDSFDIRQIQDNINKLPDTIKPIFERLISEQESFEADWFKNFYKTYSKTMSYAERIATVQDQAKKARTDAKERGVGKEGLAAIDTKEKQDIAGIRLEELKNSDEWVLAFENLEKVGKRSLEMLITRISQFIELSGSSLPVDQLRAIKKELEQVQTELEKRDPYRQAIEGITDYIAALKAMAKARKMSNDDPKKEQALARAENARAKALVKIQNAAQGVGEQLSAMSNALSVFDEFLDLEDTSDAKAVLEGVATGIGILTAALTLLGAVLSFIQAIPIVAVITGIIVALASVAKVIANLKTAKLNRELEAQDAIIKNLERSYKRLSDAIEDAFGSEYIALYQQQLLNLEANEEAIKKKIAALEDARDDAKSGKKEKEYQEQIDGLNDELADVEQSIVDIKKDFQTFFAGTDITSAAKDFAQAWLDAYKSFGSTTAAMKEKFRDMIDNMVVSSLAAKIVEGALKPVFDEMAKWADTEGKISEEGIAAIASVTSGQIDVINESLSGVMEKLAGLGINMRGTGSTLTGISKDIAGASEESILGLAAGINTQNYYMSYMPTISQNVAAIVTLLGGENAVSQPGTTLPETSTFGDELFRGQMSRIDENLALLVDLVRSVRSVKQSSTNTHVIAVTNN